MSVVRWRKPYGILSSSDYFETMGSAFIQLDTVLLLFLNSVEVTGGNEIGIIIFTLTFFFTLKFLRP